MSLNVTNFLHVWKVSCVGTSQSTHFLEVNKASLKTSITKEAEWFCITISTEEISLCYWKPPFTGFQAPHWSPALQADSFIVPSQPVTLYGTTLTITKSLVAQGQEIIKTEVALKVCFIYFSGNHWSGVIVSPRGQGEQQILYSIYT